VKGKAAQKKRRNDKADNKRAATTANNTPKMTNGGRGKNTHQLWMNIPSAKKTWAEVVKSGGINVQIVLGNGNLRRTTPMTRRGERRGGAARRVAKREEEGERGAVGRGKGGPEEITNGGNNGGQRGKNGRGREEDWEDPGPVASEQTGLLDKTTWDGPRQGDDGEQTHKLSKRGGLFVCLFINRMQLRVMVMVQLNTKHWSLNRTFRFPPGLCPSAGLLFIYLFIYSLIACNLKVMAMVQKS
jgi:hypothetical protein